MINTKRKRIEKQKEREKYNILRKRGLVISLNNVSKKFKIPHEKKHTVFDTIISIFKKNNYDEFYALKDITLEIHKGEFLGIIGQNGSGKSTLLKTIAQIIEPTSGTVYTEGKIVSFINLGVGFHKELTAKENMYLYGIVMGMSKKEITEKYESIVNFADTKKFMDAKLKAFSSGMAVRLAFSTAIQTNPDILLLDEVFAVGDKEFQNKCHKVLAGLKAEGITILFSSHDLKLINQYCTKTVYLRHGKIVMQGDTDKVVRCYLQDNTTINK